MGVLVGVGPFDGFVFVGVTVGTGDTVAADVPDAESVGDDVDDGAVPSSNVA